MLNKPDPAVEKRETVVIKKYANRRLYNTETSSYVTLDDLGTMVRGDRDFVVYDAKTGDDLTRTILMQIILDEEAGGSPMFTASALASIIRFYGHAMQGFMGGYLERNIQSLLDVQARLGDQSKVLTPEMWTQFMGAQAPLLQGMLGGNLEQTKNLFTEMQEQMHRQTEQLLGTFGVKR